MKYLSLFATYTWKHWLVIYALVALFSFFPLLSVIAGSLLGKALGCGAVTENVPLHCPAGSTIENLSSIGFFGLITFPVGVCVTILLVIGNILWYFTRDNGEKERP